MEQADSDEEDKAVEESEKTIERNRNRIKRAWFHSINSAKSITALH
jgi:hypothetical protein